MVERINRTLLEMLALNVAKPTENWGLQAQYCTKAYRSAVQASTGFTPHLILFGREMRLPLDIMYRPPEAFLTRFDYPNEVCMTLADAYERSRERLHFAHKRQRDYYDRRMSKIRFAPRDLVCLRSPFVDKGVVPKFLEPWTKLYTVTKTLCDITYEIQVKTTTKTKIVHFDRLKKATLNPVILL